MVEISAPSISQSENGRQRLSALVGGHEVWFEMPADLAPPPRGEMFLSIGLFMALNRSEDLTVDEALPLCPDLLARLPYIVKILQQWNPDFRTPEVTAKAAPAVANSAMVLSSFSGGVDSMFTFDRYRDAITHLLVTNCFDEDGADEPFELLVEKVEKFAAEQGKRALPVATNLRRVSDAEDMSWEYLHGPFLCTLATAFGPSQYLIPASNSTRALKPWGSHPYLDPLWATAATPIEHEGLDERRTGKTVAIAADPGLLRHLQVCWNSKIHNCGQCSKCIRTRLVLWELGIEDGPFPPGDPLAHIDKLKTTSDAGTSHIWDLWEFFETRGKHEVASKLRRRLDRYLLKRSLESLVKSLIGRRGQALYHRLRGSGWRQRRIILRDPDNFE